MKRRAYLLVEALISISLILIAAASVFEIESICVKKALKTRMELEAETQLSCALTTLVEKLYLKEIPLANIIDDARFPVKIPLEGGKWIAYYAFEIRDKDPDNDPPNMYKIDVLISLHHSSGLTFFTENKQVGPFVFCIQRS